MCIISNLKEVIQLNKRKILHFIAFKIDHISFFDSRNLFSKDSKKHLQVGNISEFTYGLWQLNNNCDYDEWKLRQCFGFAVNSNENLDN